MSHVEVSPELVFTSLKAATDQECLEVMAGRLVELGYAKPSFPGAVVAREKVYPTGLPTAGAGVAIPHADAEHVIRPGLAIGVLAETVLFGLMAGEGERVPVDLVFMLAINDPARQVEVLEAVSNLVQDSDALARLKTCTKEEVVSRVGDYFRFVGRGKAVSESGEMEGDK